MHARTGALVGEDVIDIALARAALLASRSYPRPIALGEAEAPSDMLELLRGGAPAMDAAREAIDFADREGTEAVETARVRHALGEVRLLAPLPRPNSLRDYMVIENHLRGAIAAGAMKAIPDEWYNIPAHWKGNVDEVYGPDDTVPWPDFTDKLDYELEIGAVIGRPGRRIPADAASAYIAGYTIYNDWSARDLQVREMSIGAGPGLSKDFATSLGPCIATPDEFDRDNAKLEARIDGEVWSTGAIGEMHFSFEQIIEWTSQEQTLHPGDVLGSGAVSKGCGLELNRWLTQGATVELEAEGIGVLRNRLGSKAHGDTPAA